MFATAIFFEMGFDRTDSCRRRVRVRSRAYADEDFPFGFELSLDTAPEPGSKRIPTLDIGDNGEAALDLWCKAGKGQFSVAGNTVIFVPGAMEERACSPDRAAADDELVAALSAATNWKTPERPRPVHGTKIAAPFTSTRIRKCCVFEAKLRSVLV